LVEVAFGVSYEDFDGVGGIDPNDHGDRGTQFDTIEIEAIAMGNEVGKGFVTRDESTYNIGRNPGLSRGKNFRRRHSTFRVRLNGFQDESAREGMARLRFGLDIVVLFLCTAYCWSKFLYVQVGSDKHMFVTLGYAPLVTGWFPIELVFVQVSRQGFGSLDRIHQTCMHFR
jgi:hypothetical protein